MDDTAAEILGAHRVMAISTVRPDGWPQTTLVGYANDGPVIYFLIFRASQKFANIGQDARVSMAVGSEPRDIRLAKAVYGSGRAAEVTDAGEREHAWQMLTRQHPNLAGSAVPDRTATALMKATCEHLTVLDYTKGLGHTDALNLTGMAGSE
jgi:nitroimidazol reductase NimA-like FMN-containing flavoprotein (pyridoxamine 5'-phosphate oxidase superfamily)